MVRSDARRFAVWFQRFRLVNLVAAALITPGPLATAQEQPAVAFESQPGSVAVSIGGQPFATYVYEDEAISRPYFAHVRVPGGPQVTRNHPPVEGQDSPDHGTFHPGLWMSFGDISGSDYWRLAAPVKFLRFEKEPRGGEGTGAFTARFDYLDQRKPDEVVCHEDFVCLIRAIPEGVLILWDSTFSSDREFTFGDQEEMGLGFRVATPIRAERDSEIGLAAGNGEMVNSKGGRNEQDIWGETADWCDFSGDLDGQRVGIAVFPHPKNFRPSRFHARDYGMLAVNPFGRAVFGKGEKSEIKVKPGDNLRLRFGVLIHGVPKDESLDVAGAYQTYLKLTEK